MDSDKLWILLCKPRILCLRSKYEDYISTQCAINMWICLHNPQIDTRTPPPALQYVRMHGELVCAQSVRLILFDDNVCGRCEDWAKPA